MNQAYGLLAHELQMQKFVRQKAIGLVHHLPPLF